MDFDKIALCELQKETVRLHKAAQELTTEVHAETAKLVAKICDALAGKFETEQYEQLMKEIREKREAIDYASFLIRR